MSMSSSSAAGGGGGGALVYLGFSAVLAALAGAASEAAGAAPPADPKYSEAFLPLRALATALVRLMLTVSPAALMTAVRESTVMSAWAPSSTKAA
jgi:hypothetical protein